MFFNSSECAWVDMKAFINGKQITKLLGVKMGKKVDKEALHGAGAKAFQIQSGEENCSGEVKLYAGHLADLNRAAKAAGYSDLTGLNDLVFVIDFRPSFDRPLQQYTALGVSFQEWELALEQNAKSIPVTLPFLCLDIVTVEG